MSHIAGLDNYQDKFPKHGSGWSKRQRRRFVRQMALMRLQMLELRTHKIGGLMRHISPMIHSRVRDTLFSIPLPLAFSLPLTKPHRKIVFFGIRRDLLLSLALGPTLDRGY
jgi:hypothetical protein